MFNSDLDISLTFEEIDKIYKEQNYKINKSNNKIINSNSKASKTIKNSKSNLYLYFENNGFKVVDLRKNGGCLWVIGDKKDLEPYVKKAIRIFKVSGNYGSGKATKHKSGWWTKSNC